MESLLLLIGWMSIGALCAVRSGPSGAIPIAVFFGPLWPAVTQDMTPEPARALVVVKRAGDM